MAVDASDLVTAVGALLDVDIGEDTTPDTAQVQAWLYDGAVKIMSMLPLAQLGGFVKTATAASVGEDWNLEADSVDVLRVVSVAKGDYPCKEMPLIDLLSLRKRAPNLFTDSYAYSAFGSGGDLSIKFHPATAASVSMVYVGYPSEASGWLVGENFTPPISWAEHLASYAAMQGKIQDEEPEQAQMMYQMWVQSVQILAQGKVESGEA